jgi:hypothetical protein
MSIQTRIAALKDVIAALEADAIKTDNGNKSAGTRVRKALQEVVNTSKEIRKEVLEARNEENAN